MESTPRENIPLSSMTFACGQVGRLATLAKTFVLPGDSYSLSVAGGFRLSPLLRGLTMDCRVELFTFYQPHRHLYSNWLDFVEDGVDTSETLATDTLPIESSYFGTRLGVGETVPLYLSRPPVNIWNEYFRPPIVAPKKVAPYTNAFDAIYGPECANLETIWSAGVDNQITAADYEVSAGGGVVSLLDVAAQEARLKTELERNYFNSRYREIVRNMGGYTTIDADNRPQLVQHSSFWASGYDVDGTGDQSLGNFSGRVTQAFNYNTPRWRVPEHGSIWVMMLVRFPPVNYREEHYLVNNPSPSYKEIIGDPAIVQNEPPVEVSTGDFFVSGGATSLGFIPYGSWYRYQPHNVHREYAVVSGFPFQDTLPTTSERANLVDSSDYDNLFASRQLAHWNVQARLDTNVIRRLPPARESILAGT